MGQNEAFELALVRKRSIEPPVDGLCANSILVAMGVRHPNRICDFFLSTGSLHVPMAGYGK